MTMPVVATVLVCLAILAAAYAVRVLLAGRKPRTMLAGTKTRVSAVLVSRTQVSHNSAVYRFALPNPSAVLGLPIGQHITLSAVINGRNIVRSYTPTTLDADEAHRGFFELLVKTYPTGIMSSHIASMNVGDHIDVSGPKGQFRYERGCVSQLGMIAGGTGITPMLQIIRHILADPLDTTSVSLIFANVEEHDILLKTTLDALVRKHPNRFNVYYVLNKKPNDHWTGGVGFITKEMIQTHLPPPTDTNSKILLCGPPPMIEAMRQNLVDLGFQKPKAVSKMPDQVFIF